jgi:hypothetical protein
MSDRGRALGIVAPLAASLGWTARWHAVADPPNDLVTPIVFLVAAALLVLLSGTVALVLGFGPLHWPALTGVSLSALATLAVVVVTDGTEHVGALRLGLLVTVLFVVAVALTVRPERRVVGELVVVGGVWVVGLAVWWAFAVDAAPSALVWDRSDQLTYLRIANQIVNVRFGKVPYLLGVPVLLGAPLVAVGGRTGSELATGNLVNLVLLPATLALGLPAAVLLTARSALAGIARARSLPAIGVAAAIATVLLLGYATVAPDYLSGAEADLVARRIVGLVYAPETLSLLYLTGLLYVLARSTDSTCRWSPVAVGLATAVAVMIREYNAVLVFGFVLALLTMPNRRRDAVVTGAVAAVAFLPQVLDWVLVYDSPFFPNRLVLWEDSGRAGRWAPIVEERYGLTFEGDPPQMSWRYVSTNLPEVLGHYGLPLAVATVLGGVLLWARRSQWRLWGYCLGVVWGTVLFNSAYINIEVTYRYNAIVVPAATVIVAAAVVLATGRRLASEETTDPPSIRARTGIA